MRRLLLAATAFASIAVAALPADAQKISQFQNLPTVAANLSDAFAAQSAACPNSDCRITVGQIIAAFLQNPPNFTQPMTVTNASPPAFSNDYGLLVGQIGSTSGGTIYSYAIGNCGAGCTNADAMRGVATVPSGSTTANVNAIAGYVLDNVANSANGGNAVSLFGVAIANANGAQVWGLNANVEDSSVPFTASNGANKVLLNELDFNVTSPNTMVNGLVLQGASVAQPQLANAVVVGSLSIGTAQHPWSNGFYSEDGAANVAMYVGRAGAVNGANLNSQPIAFAATDASGNAFDSFLYGTPQGLMAYTPALIPHDNDATSIGGPNGQNFHAVWSEAINLEPKTASQLPGCSYTFLGTIQFVTDSQSTQIETNLQGGGQYHVPVFCDGAEWVVL